jgi:Xaa-Pro aminopeptidase
MTDPLPVLQISPEEHAARTARLVEFTRGQGLTGAVLFDRDYILYYTGFAFIPTERPMAFVMDAGGQAALFVPRLEREHAASQPAVQHVEVYPEYPDRPHPMERLAALMAAMGLRGRVGADEDGYPWQFGYRGPQLSELTGAAIAPIRAFVEDQMAVKSEAELRCIRESVRWATLAHTLLQRYTAVGARETEVSQRASGEATRAMLDEIGPVYRAQSATEDGPSAGYRGQIGRQAAIPHSLTSNLTFQPGDVLVTGAGAPVWGYLSELERTMFVGPPGDSARRMFEHMLALQDTALRTLRPGIACAEVDRAVRAYFEQHQLMDSWRHHSGHTIGLRYHEGPFLDSGDETRIQPGMVFTVEPGLYRTGLGGFRHSDTVVITEDGTEILTAYPRDIESLTLPV